MGEGPVAGGSSGASANGMTSASGAVDGSMFGPFAGELYRRLAAGAGNLVFSPVSVGAALTLALCGARGRTAGQFAAALHLPPPEAAPPAGALRWLSGALTGLPGGGVIFRAPNTAWLQSGYPVLPAFTAMLRDAGAVRLRDADFAHAAETARRDINDLVARETEGRIADLLPAGAVDRDTRLALVNAMYLKAPWTHPFAAADTTDAPFYPGGPGAGTPVPVRMMHLTRELRYRRGDGWQAVVLGYGTGTLAMTIVLPDGPPGSLPPGLAADLGTLPARTRRQRVALALPRFRLAGRFSLLAALRTLGVTDAFDPEAADFSGITTAERLHVSAVVHQAFAEVTEAGTEAAAATATVIRYLAARKPTAPVTMTVDHPFLFAITDTATGLPLFLGQVTDPSGR